MAMWHLWKLVWVAAAPGLPTCHLFLLPASPLPCLGPLQRKSWDACPLLPTPSQVSSAPGCGLRTIGGNDSFREALELGQAPEIAGKDLGGQCPCALGSVWECPCHVGRSFMLSCVLRWWAAQGRQLALYQVNSCISLTFDPGCCGHSRAGGQKGARW